jgi:pilus assembly protein CpaB
MKIPSISNIQIKRSWLVLGAAVLVGLLAAWAASSYLNNRVADLEHQARGNNVSVVVAKTDLPRGSRLDTSNLAVRAIPQTYAHSGSVMPDQFERIEGQNLAFPVKAGETIMWSLLEGKKAPTFSTRVEIGRRALTLPVDEINSISGMLEPGDLIDLLVTKETQGRKVTSPMLQSVRIMATGQRAVDDPKSGEKRMYNTVTLDTTPQEALNLIDARESGRVTAILRNPEDQTLPQQQLFTSYNLKPKASPGLVSNPKQVPVLYGGRSGKIPLEGLQLGQYITAAPAQPMAPINAGSSEPGVHTPVLQGGTGTRNMPNAQIQ